MKRRPSSVRGFTFLEVIVALALFALTGLALASAYLNVLEARQAALRRDTHAADLRLVRAALGAEPSLDKATTWNELPLPGGRTARWRAVVTPTSVADLFDVALEVDLTDERGNSLPAIGERLRLLRPTWSVPAEREELRTQARSRLAKRTFQ